MSYHRSRQALWRPLWNSEANSIQAKVEIRAVTRVKPFGRTQKLHGRTRRCRCSCYPARRLQSQFAAATEAVECAEAGAEQASAWAEGLHWTLLYVNFGAVNTPTSGVTSCRTHREGERCELCINKNTRKAVAADMSMWKRSTRVQHLHVMVMEVNTPKLVHSVCIA
jgi:hypothetical protein